MAKVHLQSFDKENEKFALLIKSQQIRRAIRTQHDLAKLVNSSYMTTNKKVNNPETLTVEELRTWIITLDIKKEDVIDFIYGEEK